MLEKIFEISNSISDVIAKKCDYGEMLSEIVELIAVGLDARVCSVYVYKKETDELILNATYGLNQSAIGKIRIKPGEGLTGTCFKENKILNIKDPSSHPNFKYFEASQEENYKYLLAIPLNIATQCLGVLIIQTNEAEYFSDTVISMAKTIGTQLANLFLNADILNTLSVSNQEQSKESTHQALASIDALGYQPLKVEGLAGNTGVSLGDAYIFNSTNPYLDITYCVPASCTRELSILNKALAMAIERTVALEKKALSLISEADASIFFAHLLFLEDKTLVNKIREAIILNTYTAEFALKKVYDEYTKLFSSLKDQAFRDKTMDFKDVMIRLLETVFILKNKDIEHFDKDIIEAQNIILIAKEILPSDLLKLPTDNIKGIICERGGASAHVSILAKALNIPALMGAKKASSLAKNNDKILLDCYGEIAYINPPDFILNRYHNILLSQQQDDLFMDNAHLEARTSNGSKIFLRANIGLVNETSLLSKYGAEGIGLYRTEFLYMIRDRLPSEEEQYEIFSKIFRFVNNYEVTIRTLDAGSDKPLPYLEYQEEENPALGNRGARLLLSKPEILKPHLKAILRAGANGRLNIMFPMISTCHEIIKLKEIIEAVKKELIEANVPFSRDYKLGIMIEVPSIIMDLKNAIKEVDFVSVGSNDLFQYLYASDRTNDQVQNKNLVLHPGFLRLIKIIGDDCKAKNYMKVSVCGEIASNPLFVPLLIGSAIHELSMPPRFIPLIKETVRHFSTNECVSIMARAIDLANESQVYSLLRSIFEHKNILYLIQEKTNTNLQPL
ncbi:MAG: phosphoenolpyruvate--protein phosphotransferase [Lentisphaerota bacterium]